MVLKIRGPYVFPDGRKRLCIVDTETGKRTTKSYAKHLLEQKIGRELQDDETCDHKDEDPTNDDPDNLQVLTKSDNAKKSALLRRHIEYMIFICPCCGKEFEREARYYRHNQINYEREVPFCSRHCAGKYCNQYAKRP